MVFYLVLRALDTIEDDMVFFESDKAKAQELQAFHKNALGNSEWSMNGVGEGDERRLLEDFPRCHRVLASLPEVIQAIIKDIAHRMALGMAEFACKDQAQGTLDTKEYNRYCYFVAGLVGEGCTRLFTASGFESLECDKHLLHSYSNDMGIFLQKHNIIVDYAEDLTEGRAFWPQAIWKKYSLTGKLDYFTHQSDEATRSLSLHCLNEMIVDALEHLPSSLKYLSLIKCKEVFRFCSIPLLLAFASLVECYSNGNVFTGSVKLRKGLACKLILQSNDYSQAIESFKTLAIGIQSHAIERRRRGTLDPNYSRTMQACEAIVNFAPPGKTTVLPVLSLGMVGLITFLYIALGGYLLP